MLVHKGGKIKNWGGKCRDVTPTKLQSQNILKERGVGLEWGQDGFERKIIVFVKIQKKNFFFGGKGVRSGGGVVGLGGGGVRVDVNREVKFL